MNKIMVLLFVLLSVIASNTLAQSEYTVEHYTSENGLPQNSVKSISIDAYGFVWLATEDGLVRFDGHHFFVFNHFNLPVTFNRVPYITTCVRDTVHPGTGRSQISYAYFVNKQFVKIENGTARLDTNYYHIRESHLDYLKKNQDEILEAKGLPNALYMNGPYSRHLLVAGNQESDFYLCEKSRVSSYKNWKKRSQVAYSNPNLWNFFSLGVRLYHYHGDGTITTFIENKPVISELSGDILKDPAYSSFSIKSKFFWSTNAGQAFIYLGKKLYLLEPQIDGKVGTRLLISDFNFEALGIEHIIFDQISQRVYLGSLTKGLFVLSRHQFQPLTIRGDQRQNSLYSQLVLNANSIITPTGNIIGKNPLTNQLIDEKIPAINKANPSDGRISIRDNGGAIWFRNGSELIRVNDKLDKVIRRWTFENSPKEIIEAIIQIKDGPIWISVTNQGLYKLDPVKVDAKPEPFFNNPRLRILCLAAQGDDILLLGTQTGLYRLSISSKKATLIEGTKGIYIKSIHVFTKNLIWLTALDKGIMLINPTERVITFPLDKNAYLASPHCIINDQRGFFWIPTNRGLFQIAINDLMSYADLQLAKTDRRSSPKNQPPDIPDLFYMYHDQDEGFKTNEFNGNCQPCAVRLPNGYISLPSMEGLVWFKPENITNYTPNSPIVLDKVEINGEAMALRGDTLHFPVDPENIRLFFATPYAGKNYNLNLSYALVRQFAAVKSSDWISLDNEDFTIRYSSLRSGNYTLLVRKMDGFGINRYTIKRVYFSVQPEWYETAWAIISYIALFILIIYIYSAYRVRKIKRENARLEDLVNNRTQKLHSALKELEASENKMAEQVHIMSRLLASITHDIQSPLRYVAFTSGTIPKMIQKGKLTDVSNLGTVISDITDQMSTMLRDLLDYIKIQLYGKSMNFEAIDLKMLIDLKLSLFRPVIEQNGSEFSNQVPSNVRVYSDYQLLSIVLHNLLDNAAKYTHQGMIRIYSQFHEDGQVELILSNPGVGISQEVIDIITSTDKLENVDPTLKNNRSVGLGLLIAKEVADLLMINLIVTHTNEINLHLFFKPQTQ